ncbi:MAG: insulinase family protein [Bacteroidia bacterium]
MKRLIILVFICFGFFEAEAQLDRSKRPVAGPAPEIKLNDPDRFTLDNGLKVFVVQNSKLPRLTVSLVLDTDPVMEGEAVGYVDITGELIRTGTKNKTKAEIDAYIDQIGANIGTSSNGLHASALSKYKNELFSILSELILESEFRQEELDLIKKQTISGLQTEKDDANAIAGKIRNVMVYGKQHPYGQISTEQSVEKVNLALCKHHFDTYFRPNVGYLALVGDITLEEAKKLVTDAFGKWEQKEVPKHSYMMPTAPARTRVIVVDRPVAVQTVINIAHPVDLKPGADDAIAASVMNTILGGGDARLFNNLRETYGFTYGAYSSLSRNKLVGQFNAYAQVRNAVTDSSVMQFLYELNRIRDSIAPESEVNGILSYLNGTFAIGLQNPQTIASYAIEIERHNMPKDYYRNYLKNLAALTPTDVQRVAQKYILPSQAYIICVGSKNAMAESLGKYAASGEVEFFDMYGNPVKEAKPLPEGLTAQTVVDRYINAIGGIQNWKKIKNIEVEMGASMQGMSIAMNVKKMRPNLIETKVVVNGAMVMQQVTFDGTKAKQSGMQGAKEITGEELEKIKSSASMLPEADYSGSGYKLSLLGIESINGKDAYILEVENQSGSKQTEYYDIESGLKVREVSIEKGPQGEVVQTSDLSDYREVKGGIKVPHKTTIDLGIQMLELELSKVNVNAKMKAADFKVN